MKTRDRIEKKGYQITSNIGYKNGEQCITSVSAKRGNTVITKKSLTQILKSI